MSLSVQEIAGKYRLDPWQWLEILIQPTIAARLRIALPHLISHFGDHLTQVELAEVVGSTRETISRAISSLRDEGFVETHWIRVAPKNFKWCVRLRNGRG